MDVDNNGIITLFGHIICLQVYVYIGFCMNYAVYSSWCGFIHVYCCHYHFVFLWFCSHNTMWLLRSPQTADLTNKFYSYFSFYLPVSIFFFIYLMHSMLASFNNIGIPNLSLQFSKRHVLTCHVTNTSSLTSLTE